MVIFEGTRSTLGADLATDESKRGCAGCAACWSRLALERGRRQRDVDGEGSLRRPWPAFSLGSISMASMARRDRFEGEIHVRACNYQESMRWNR
jgi:hypothetical protein